MSRTYEYLFRKLNNAKKMHVTPRDFLDDCVEYFEWAEGSPLVEEKVLTCDKVIEYVHVSKVRAFTKTGLATFLNMPTSRLESYRKLGGKWAEAVEMVEQVIFTQKFENAAAGLLNANIISRDLGLADKQEVESHVTQAEPITFNINPIKTGTYLADDSDLPQ